MGELPRASSLEWKRSRRANYSRIDRGPVRDGSEIVPPSLLVQRLVMKLVRLIVHFTPILQRIDGITRALADICSENIHFSKPNNVDMLLRM